MRHEVKKLTEGFDVHERKDGKVIRVRAEGHPVAEVVVGAETVRVNFRDKPGNALDLHIGGNSKSWPGGGVQVTGDNIERVKKALQEAVESVSADAPLGRDNGHTETVTIPVRRRGRKMADTTVDELLDELTEADEEGILTEALSSDIAHLLRRRLDLARERRSSRDGVAA
jgi:hypothetical protein